MEHFPTKEKLHTDVLEDKYGSVSAEVVRHDDVREKRQEGELAIREAHLVDVGGVSRTYALTFLTYDPNNLELYNIDSEIRRGGLIGKTFRDHGYEIKKNVIDVFTLPLTKELKERFKVDGEYAKARVSEFYARKGQEEPVIYGRVMELYTPDFRGPVINQVDMNQVNPSTEILEHNGISKPMIWDHLDRSSDVDEWQDLKESYERAKEDSLPEIFKWRKKIGDFINGK